MTITKDTRLGWYWAMRTRSPEKFKEVVYVTSDGMVHSTTSSRPEPVEAYAFFEYVKRPEFPDEEIPRC